MIAWQVRLGIVSVSKLFSRVFTKFTLAGLGFWLSKLVSMVFGCVSNDFGSLA